MSRMTRARLRAMKRRWQRDLDALEEAFPDMDYDWNCPEVEVLRNLGTAIAWVDGIIANPEPFTGRAKRIREEDMGA